jgi:serine/threonine protein kinase
LGVCVRACLVRTCLPGQITTMGSLDEASTRFLIGEIVSALESIHNAGFVYGDLKPENIVLTTSGHAKLTDFGAVRPLTGAVRFSLCGDQVAHACTSVLLKGSAL